VLGAPVWFWIKSAFKAGLYGTATGVFARGWPMFLAACAQKIGTVIGGRRKAEVLSFEFKPKGKSERASQTADNGSAMPVSQTARH
jgi:hypothetical protein